MSSLFRYHPTGSYFDETGLVAYYKLESSGNDYYGSSNLTASVGAPTYVAGKFGNACNLVEGSAQYYEGLYDLGIGSGNMTCSCWVVCTTAPTNNEYDFIWETGDAGTFVSYSFSYVFFTGFGYYCYFWRPTHGVDSKHTEILYTLPAGWNNIVCVYDGTYNYIYVNGSSIGVAANVGSGNGTSGCVDSVNIGKAKNFGTGTQYWDGKIDEVMFFNRAWSETEVLNYYKMSSRKRDAISLGTMG